MIRWRNRRVRSSRGAVLGRRPGLQDPALVDEQTRFAMSRAKPISWVAISIVIPDVGELPDQGEDLGDKLRVEGARDLVEQHEVGLHREGPDDRDALLLAARQPVG